MISDLLILIGVGFIVVALIVALKIWTSED